MADIDAVMQDLKKINETRYRYEFIDKKFWVLTLLYLWTFTCPFEYVQMLDKDYSFLSFGRLYHFLL